MRTLCIGTGPERLFVGVVLGLRRAIPDEKTEAEILFLTRYLPRPRYTRIVDLCCGTGRHTRALAEQGYEAVGIDRSATALETARRESDADITYHEQDMQEFTLSVDAVVCLWQSFGYFGSETNRDVLRHINANLTPAGRFVLDIYNRAFFEEHLGTREFTRAGVIVTERRSMADDRLTVRLSYDDRETIDVFE